MDQESGLQVTEADVEASKKLRGLFTNRVYIQPHGDGLHLRINFGEVIAGESQYHTAIVVPTGDALEFGQLIYNMALAAAEHANSLMGGGNADG